MDEPQEKRVQTRRHHYVPAFLLQGFTPSGEREDFLWVHDREQRKTWRVKPDQAAHERDYYRVDIPEVDPNIVETTFAETIETRAAALVREMVRTHELPHGEDLQALIEFVTLLALRTPSFRRMYERNMEHMHRHFAKTLLSRREPFDRFIEEQRQQGVEIPPEITYEGMRDFAFDDERYMVEVPRTNSVQMLLKMWQGIVPVFLARRWSLLFTKPDEGYLLLGHASLNYAHFARLPAAVPRVRATSNRTHRAAQPLSGPRRKLRSSEHHCRGFPRLHSPAEWAHPFIRRAVPLFLGEGPFGLVQLAIAQFEPTTVQSRKAS